MSVLAGIDGEFVPEIRIGRGVLGLFRLVLLRETDHGELFLFVGLEIPHAFMAHAVSQYQVHPALAGRQSFLDALFIPCRHGLPDDMAAGQEQQDCY